MGCLQNFPEVSLTSAWFGCGSRLDVVQEWAWQLLAEVSLGAEAFQEVKQWCLEEVEPVQSGDEGEVPLAWADLPEPQSSNVLDKKLLNQYYQDGDTSAFDDFLFPGHMVESTDGVVPQLMS